MKPFKRVDRIKPLLQEEISRMLLLDVKDPRLKAVTITDVKLTDDLRNAKIFFSVLGGSAQREEILTGLKRAAGYLRGELGKRLTLKFIPHLQFCFDDSYDQQARILDLIDQIHETETPDE